eukprot:CAMPEP_0170531392 /NCGR_PEP_ID=MMETSP0209-20121228/61378_1 /TAXON_ID=665100 ORGANISM="Litonotus pictus, Strain P1" /NCGR_SAMPLE_ID=MMETSP0209 /ASSEMBLY_ACC=CAM_ASM_000301 /LENGTH=206 /DNA_ID=CAMNT_0010825965 /DNA_START=438 /DNA_END=1055 /DNA_ORIENTATION=-
MKKDDKFRKYIFETNKDIDEKRINRLNEFLSEVNNNNRLDYHKFSLKRDLLKLWKVDIKEEDLKLLNEGIKSEKFNYKKEHKYDSKDTRVKINKQYDESFGLLGNLMDIITNDKEKEKKGNANKTAAPSLLSKKTDGGLISANSNTNLKDNANLSACNVPEKKFPFLEKEKKKSVPPKNSKNNEVKATNDKIKVNLKSAIDNRISE